MGPFDAAPPIAEFPKRFHQLAEAVSSVHRILVRHEMNRLPANQKHRAHAQRWQRYEKPQPRLVARFGAD